VRPAGARLHRGWPGWLLVALALNVTAAAVYGGVGLMTGTMAMDDSWLQTGPFHSWTLPGLALLLTVALPQACLLVLAALGDRRAVLAGYLVGAGLILWIVVQLAVFRRFFVLQPIVVGFGVVELALAAWWARRSIAAASRG